MLSNVSYLKIPECKEVANYSISQYLVILQKPTGATTSTSLAHIYYICICTLLSPIHMVYYSVKLTLTIAQCK